MKNRQKGCVRRSKLQNFLRFRTMVVDRIFTHISTNRPGFEIAAEKWNYLITMTLYSIVKNLTLSTSEWQ